MAQKKPLDRIPRTPRRGRPPKINPSFVRGSADTYRVLLERRWNDLERLWWNSPIRKSATSYKMSFQVITILRDSHP